MRNRPGVLWSANTLPTVVLTVRAALVGSTATGRPQVRSRFAAPGRCVMRCCHPERCGLKASPFARRCGGCRSSPASISTRLMRKASGARCGASALPTVTSPAAVFDRVPQAPLGVRLRPSRCRLVRERRQRHPRRNERDVDLVAVASNPPNPPWYPESPVCEGRMALLSDSRTSQLH